jgi:hypothetical protein
MFAALAHPTPSMLYTSQLYWERRGILKIQYWISCAVGNKHAHSSFSPLLYLKCALSGFSFVLFVSLLLNFACFNILFRRFSLCVQYGKSEKSSVLSEAKFIDPWTGDIVDSDIGLSYRPASQCILAGQYDNPTVYAKNSRLYPPSQVL